ncbi:aldehyde dehydrogenase [Actomonas aquatica]|uniref:Aldehyde dehydrogenase n=1 Tax=Actomonas aquatica TaxID=2866162 RepID=A0ABZ1C853_9BACT|nr:aldehyde dehydrogenase [Opitutus sp. WL0086]WRQ87646.1 aldehyde dehydrogenase [Opitutus sp. WL0086]
MSASLNLNEDLVRSVVAEVLQTFVRNGATPATSAAPQILTPAKRPGVFTDVAAACAAAQAAQLKLLAGGIAARAKVIEIVKTLCTQNAEIWGKFEFNETKIGRLAHKVEKLQIVKLVPGVEWLRPDARSGDHGITLEEFTPFGVIAAILPMTHSIPTLSGNIINIVAAGNSVVFNPHPGGAKSAALAVAAFNEAIKAETGIENLVCTIETPSLDSFDALCAAPEVKMICVTGGPAVVAAAMKSGKRAVCAGPGNPPVLVDDTVCVDKAARDIIAGGAFDNNLLCIGEKEVFVLDSVADKFMAALGRNGAHQLNTAQFERLTAAAFTNSPDAGGCSHPVLNRAFVGLDAATLAGHAGTSAPANTEMLFAECDALHAYVIEEQMMPVLPIVRVNSIEEGIRAALAAEHGYKHSAIIHSLNVDRMTAMARALDTTLFVKNGPSTAGLGLGGEGYLSYSIATTTGEGITTPRTFTRTRRCVMVDQLRIY